jgi:hypothetical protein
MELAKLSFQLKVDLAIALQLIRSESRPLFLAVNTVRNRFAHRSGYQFNEQSGLNLKNTVSSLGLGFETPFKSLEEPYEILRGAIALSYFMAAAALERVKDQKIESMVTTEMLQETLQKRPKAVQSLADSPTYAEFKRRVSERKKLDNE